jgi:oligopeptide/dipeptide ABC transporter ATP-binding protein
MGRGGSGVSEAATPILEVDDLTVHFPLRSLGRVTRVVRAVNGVSLVVRRGETLGIAGESGCGKSTLARAVLQIVPPTSGRVLLDGRDVTRLRGGQRRRVWRSLQMVFQDPNDSLNPRVKVGRAVEEALLVAGVPPRDRPARVRSLLATVGLPADFARRYPHELSGGQRQRVGIARALAVGPRLLVCDEPVSALDVSVRSQILNLLQDLKVELGLGYVFVSHDMSVLRHLSDRLAVMYLGRFIEEGPNADVYARPLHPYTQALLGSVPLPDPKSNRARVRIHLSGEVPSPTSPPSGCAFHPRCPLAQDDCRRSAPVLRTLAAGHRVACHHPTPGAWTGGAGVASFS